MLTLRTCVTALLVVAFMGPWAAAQEARERGTPTKSAAATTKPAAAVSADAATAHRLADGSAFVPKNAQRQLGLRTLVAEKAEFARAIELAGRVVADPNAGGVVQASQAGRLEPGPGGLPVLGQQVRKGEVLGYVVPVVNNLERFNQQARLAEIESNREIARARLARYESLEGSIPRKDVEAARLEVRSLEQQRAAVAASLATREPLTAPVSGVVSAIHASAGQVVEARDILAEIVDPQRLLVEALAHDPRVADEIAAATVTVGAHTVTLAFLGSGRQLREQALPLLFRVEPPAPPLAVGQPLRILARTKARVAGVRLPAQAVVRNGAGETVVWIHDSAERFFPKRVQHVALDASHVALTDGVDAGDRVVVVGATALVQVR